MDQYSFDKAMRTLENFIWHDLADNYIEEVKHRISGNNAFRTLYEVFLKSLIMISPMLPFIAEDSYQRVFKDEEKIESITIQRWPEPSKYDRQQIEKGESTIEAIALLRAEKASRKIALNAEVQSAFLIMLKNVEPDLGEVKETLNIRNINILEEKVEKKLVEIRLTPKGYKKFKEDSIKILNYVNEDISRLSQKNIMGYEVEEDDFETTWEMNIKGNAVKCGNYCCAGIEKTQE